MARGLCRAEPSSPANAVTPVGGKNAVLNYVLHFHCERNHQGNDNMILIPRAEDRIGESTSEIQTRERLGGFLRFYHRRAA